MCPSEGKHVAKPRKATSNSDIDGVHRDERRNVEVSAELGQSGETLARAKAEAVGRPAQSDDLESRDDRSQARGRSARSTTEIDTE
jgi:hypothetical protein